MTEAKKNIGSKWLMQLCCGFHTTWND